MAMTTLFAITFKAAIYFLFACKPDQGLPLNQFTDEDIFLHSRICLKSKSTEPVKANRQLDRS